MRKETTISRYWNLVLLAGAVTLGVGLLRLFLWQAEGHLAPWVAALVFGGGIVAGAFLVTWAAEVAQLDIPQALALALLALVAVLPEYAVDLYFAWQAGADPQGPYVHYATANMTGANRLLVGFGWSLVALLFWVKTRRGVNLQQRGLSLELLFIGLATAYAFTIPFKGGIALWDGAVMVSLFALYMWLSSRARREEPELEGPAAAIARLPTGWRRFTIVGLFLLAGGVILASAEPFAEGLLGVGESLRVDEFILVQWVAPLASEAPEILVAVIFTLRGQAAAAMTTLISAMVNQWTLLVGTIPFVYTVSLGQVTLLGLPLDGRQANEVWLTAAQALFALVLLVRLRITALGALTLFVLWVSQIALPSATIRPLFIYIYLALTAALLLIDRGRVRELAKLLPNVVNGLRANAKVGQG